VNFPLALFLAKYEQFVVRFFRHGMVSEKFLLPGRSGAAIRQGAHFHDFVDGESDVQLDGLEYMLVAGLHCIAPDEGGGVLAINIGSLPYSAVAAFVSLVLSAFS
jgi:hypothetical protein